MLVSRGIIFGGIIFGILRYSPSLCKEAGNLYEIVISEIRIKAIVQVSKRTTDNLNSFYTYIIMLRLRPPSSMHLLE